MEGSLIQRRFVRIYQLAMDEEYAKANLKGGEFKKELAKIKKVRAGAIKNISVLKARLRAISGKDRIEPSELQKLKEDFGGIPG